MNLFYALIELTQDDVVPLSILTRQVLEKAESFDEAVSTLSTHRLIAPGYFIVGGMKPNEGAVITRDQSKVNKFSTIHQTKIYTNQLKQTHLDH